MSALDELQVPVEIGARPSELSDTIPLGEDEQHTAYDPEAAHRYWQALLQTNRVLSTFRALYLGKCSPVHLFWGALDLAVTRFSGRVAPAHPGGMPNLPD